MPNLNLLSAKVNYTEQPEAIVLQDTRVTMVRRKCFDKIYFTSQKNIIREFIACGRQLLRRR